MDGKMLICDHHTWCQSCSHHQEHWHKEECDCACSYATHRDAKCVPIQPTNNETRG